MTKIFSLNVYTSSAVKLGSYDKRNLLNYKDQIEFYKVFDERKI